MSATAGTVPRVLRDIRGPSAFGGGLRRFLSLLWLISVTEFKESYLGTVFGYLWSLMRPLMLFGVLYVVFTEVFRFGGEIEYYPVLLLFNLMLFQFFAEATTRAVDSVVRMETVVRKMQFPRMVIPLSVVLTACFNLCLNMVVVFLFVLGYGVRPTWTWLLLPVVLLTLILLTCAVSMLLASLYVKYRDVAPIWSVLSTVLLYGSPVLYTVEFVPGDLRYTFLLNPLALLLEQARKWIIDPGAPGIVEAAGSSFGVIGPALVFVGVCVLGFWAFASRAPHIAEEI